MQNIIVFRAQYFMYTRRVLVGNFTFTTRKHGSILIAGSGTIDTYIPGCCIDTILIKLSQNYHPILTLCFALVSYIINFDMMYHSLSNIDITSVYIDTSNLYRCRYRMSTSIDRYRY